MTSIFCTVCVWFGFSGDLRFSEDVEFNNNTAGLYGGGVIVVNDEVV